MGGPKIQGILYVEITTKTQIYTPEVREQWNLPRTQTTHSCMGGGLNLGVQWSLRLRPLRLTNPSILSPAITDTTLIFSL